MSKRFRLDLDTIIDQETGKLLPMIKVRNQLNKFDEQLKPIQAVCDKYNIKLEDVAETLEEYICLDNGEEL